MADEEKRRLRDEVASLAAAVSALSLQLSQVQATHHCIGCRCMRFHYQPYPIPGHAPVMPNVWYGTVSSGTATFGGSPDVAGGCVATGDYDTYTVSING